MKFKLWIEIQEQPYQEKIKEENRTWVVSYSISETSISDENLFIEGYKIKSYTEDGKTHYYQKFKFNKNLHKVIQELLFPGSNKNYLAMNRDKAWDYYHYTFYEGFKFNVHPISMGNGFFRQEFEGTQEEILNKCTELNKKWIKLKL